MAIRPVLSTRNGLSDEIYLIGAPFSGYRQLRDARAQSRLAVAGRPLRLLLLMAVALSILSAGRLVLAHLLSIALAWSFALVIQVLAVTTTRRSMSRKLPWLRVVDLHLAGNGAYGLLFASLALVALLAPNVSEAMVALWRGFILQCAVAATLASGLMTSFAFYREIGQESQARAAKLVLVELLIKILFLLGWFFAIDNILPQALGPRPG